MTQARVARLSPGKERWRAGNATLTIDRSSDAMKAPSAVTAKTIQPRSPWSSGGGATPAVGAGGAAGAPDPDSGPAWPAGAPTPERSAPMAAGPPGEAAMATAGPSWQVSSVMQWTIT